MAKSHGLGQDFRGNSPRESADEKVPGTLGEGSWRLPFSARLAPFLAIFSGWLELELAFEGRVEVVEAVEIFAPIAGRLSHLTDAD